MQLQEGAMVRSITELTNLVICLDKSAIALVLEGGSKFLFYADGKIYQYYTPIPHANKDIKIISTGA